jgi:glycine cleavage system H protein
MTVPSNLKFTKSDEWVKVEGKIATVGVSDFAQEQLSDIVFVEVTVAPGETVKQGSVAATIESVKAAADVSLPVSGKVTEINESLPNTPEVVNSDPYGEAWLLKLELTNPAELDGLMDAAAYETYLQERSH